MSWFYLFWWHSIRDICFFNFSPFQHIKKWDSLINLLILYKLSIEHNIHLLKILFYTQSIYLFKMQQLMICLYVLRTQIFMPPKELWEAYSNCTVRPSVHPSVLLRVRCLSPRFFEVGIPNLVCGYILWWRSVAYFFWVTVTLILTSDLVFRIIVSGAYLLYYLR